MSILNMYPRLQLEEASSADADNNDDASRHGGTATFSYSLAIAVVCVTMFVFCVLVASSFSIWKACASATLTALLLVVAGCFAPKRWFRRRSQQQSGSGASVELVVTVTAAPDQRLNVPPAFAFECPAPAAVSCVVCCSVCLEDVRGGEMVRQLPACGHIFHAGCIDMWLHSHRTCPMCRGVISPVGAVTPKAAAEEAPEASDDDHDLPPV